jgi:tryptophan 2,3-dioxygenase
MVHRMIGLRVGTGGSTGQSYLKGAMDSHHVFSEIRGPQQLPLRAPQIAALAGNVEEGREVRELNEI